MNPDFLALLEELLAADVRFLVVGAHALAAHGIPRATGDIDIWIHREAPNANRAFEALVRFGAPLSSLGVSVADLTKVDVVVQIGLPPRRIDILTGVSGLDFAAAWDRRIQVPIDGLNSAVPVLGKEDLVTSKQAAGRPKDLADLKLLSDSER